MILKIIKALIKFLLLLAKHIKFLDIINRSIFESFYLNFLVFFLLSHFSNSFFPFLSFMSIIKSWQKCDPIQHITNFLFPPNSFRIQSFDRLLSPQILTLESFLVITTQTLRERFHFLLRCSRFQVIFDEMSKRSVFTVYKLVCLFFKRFQSELDHFFQEFFFFLREVL